MRARQASTVLFWGSLGGSAAAIGIVAGLGEFLGYAVRLPAGYLGDKTGKTWLLTFIGYAINLLAVPALALAGNWPLAAALVVMERVGRAIRKPTVESMLSYTTGRLGKGWRTGRTRHWMRLAQCSVPCLLRSFCC